MKVLHLINSLGFGGAERQLSVISAALAGRGVCQYVVPLVAVHQGVALVPGVGVARASSPPASVARAACQGFRQVLRSPATVVVAWMYHTWLIAIVLRLLLPGRVRLLLYCRHGDPGSLKWGTSAIARACLRMARWLGVPVVFNSHRARDAHARLARGVTSAVIPNGIDVEPLPRTPHPGGRPVVGFLGRNHADKGADLLPELVATILGSAGMEIDIVIAGPGMTAWREPIAESASKSATAPFDLRVSEGVSDVASFLASVDVLLIPSRSESFPNVLIEAMAAGTLVAATSAGDIAEILGGTIAPADTVDTLAQRALELLRMPTAEVAALRLRMAEIVARRYAVSRVADAHLALWREAALA